MLSLAQAATFPIAQLTAYLSLCEIGSMQAGDRVLIHAGAGGVGLAAVHLALAFGATVLATAGSDEKRNYLRSLGVHHVFDSRKLLTSKSLLIATEGNGIDLLLNSLIGESIDEGLKSLAPGGRFLEIGLRELRTESEVADVSDSIQYHAILLGDYCRDEPALVREMFNKLTDMLSLGKLPAPRVKSFSIAEVTDAFGFMAKSRHIGRIAVTHPAIGKSGIRPDSSYLVTGGLGGLGLEVAAWLAEGGAKHIVLMGRSEPGEEARRKIDQLIDGGVEIEIACGDVADKHGLPLDDSNARPPIRGVIHAAGIVDDAILSRVDKERLRRVMHPKAGGILNIVRATDEVELDFLALFSSASSVLGSPGQAAYSAANAYLDGMAHYLQSCGRTAVSINWGAWDGSGMAVAVGDRVKKDWASRGIGVLTVEEGLRELEAAIGSGCSQVAALPINWEKFFSTNDGSDVPAFLSDLGEIRKFTEKAESSSFKESLTKLSVKQRIAVLTKQLTSELAAVLGVDSQEIDLRTGLTEQGMDSLMAVELAGRLSRLLGLKLPTTFAFDYPTLGMLVKHVDDLLYPAICETDDVDKGVTPEDDIDSLDFDNLSEAELEAALRKEIDESSLTDE